MLPLSALGSHPLSSEASDLSQNWFTGQSPMYGSRKDSDCFFASVL